MNLDSNVLQVPIEDIIPNRFQPRLSFDEKALQELSNSIKQHGIIQPLVLRKLDDKYEIIAGERRYKAATMAGLTQVPAVIANVDDNTSAEVALVENVQRKDLTPIEEAKSYKNILDKGYMTQEQLAKKMGLTQSTIANKLRLLNLDEEVQEALLNEKISERHARALLVIESHSEQKEWLKRILNERLTVRQLDMALKKVVNISEDIIEEPIISIEPNTEDIIKTDTDNVERDENLKDIEQPEPTMPNKFFNFLEDEAVNMNTELESSSNEPLFNQFSFENISSSNEENTLEEPEEIETLDDDFSVIPPSTEMIPLVDDSEYIDPISVVETLDPEYEEKQKELEGRDLKTAINTIRGCVEALNETGFVIEIEELDLDQAYQVNIKINKE